MSLVVNSINEINNDDKDSNKRKRIDDVSNSNNSTNSSLISNKKSKTELQSIVDMAGEILLSLLPENKTKEFPDPPMRRLNLVQQLFERNNKLIDEIEKNENQTNAELLYELNGNIHEIVQIYSGLEKA